VEGGDLYDEKKWGYGGPLMDPDRDGGEGARGPLRDPDRDGGEGARGPLECQATSAVPEERADLLDQVRADPFPAEEREE